MTHIKSLSPEQLAQIVQPKFRAGQIFEWLNRGVTSFDQMTNLPKDLRDRLANEFLLTVPKVLTKQESKDGTVKLLYVLHDQNTVETVFMPYEKQNSLCISSQVGCRMGCVFCASCKLGFVRHLTAGEMLDQVIFTQKNLGQNISNIVIMGIGEPLDNFDNVIDFLHLVNHPKGLNIGMRHITMSTCGLVDRIRRLAELDLQITLSVSLHAPTNQQREKIMPINKSFDIQALLAALKDYFKITGRRISFEYAMIKDENDTIQDAKNLAGLLKGFNCHVNLILLNKIENGLLEPSTKKAVDDFTKTLTDNHVNWTIRRRMGSDIDAACGQLRIGRDAI